MDNPPVLVVSMVTVWGLVIDGLAVTTVVVCSAPEGGGVTVTGGELGLGVFGFIGSYRRACWFSVVYLNKGHC